MSYSIIEILDFLGDMVINRQEILDKQENHALFFTGLASLKLATKQQLSFLANSHYRDSLPISQAGAILVNAEMANLCSEQTLAIIVQSPYLAYAKLTELFRYHKPKPVNHIHETAIVADTAILGENVIIGAYCVIGEGVSIDDNSRLESYVILEDFVKIGKYCHLKSHTFVGHHCILGHHVVLHSHASIGNEGFGYAPKGNTATIGWQKIHQLGRVVIGNQVRIGSQTCVDRGALDDTIIEDNVIIDNLVQIAHNVKIGAGTAIAACVGIAGSTQVGKRCILAGGVGLVGHIHICDDVTITGMTMVTKSITQSGSYSSGTPMMPTALWKRTAIKFKQLVQRS